MTPRVASQKADITRHTLEEAACWLGLGCWGNIVGNSHLSPGPFNSRVLISCLVPQCSHTPHWFCDQRRLANCDWMPASYTSGQPSYVRRHPTSWASWQSSLLCFQHTVPWSLHICSTQLSPIHSVGTHGNSNRDTDLYPPHNSQSIWQHTCGALGGSPIRQHYETPYFHPRHRHPPSRNGSDKKSVEPA